MWPHLSALISIADYMKLSDGLEDMEHKHKTQVGCWMATVCDVAVSSQETGQF